MWYDSRTGEFYKVIQCLCCWVLFQFLCTVTSISLVYGYHTGGNLDTNTRVHAQPKEEVAPPVPRHSSTKISNPLLSTSEPWSLEPELQTLRQKTDTERRGVGGRDTEDGRDLRRGWVVAYKKKRPLFLKSGVGGIKQMPSFQQRSSKMKSSSSVRFTIHYRNDVMALHGKTDLLQRWD